MNPPSPTAYVALLSVMVTAVPAKAEPSAENEGRIKAYLQRFPDADSNKNGILTLNELKNHYAKSRKEKKTIKNHSKAIKGY